MMRSAVTAVLLLCAVCAVSGEIERDVNFGFAEIREFNLRYSLREVPLVRFSVGGVIARLPPVARLYYDTNEYDASAFLSVSATPFPTGASVNCTGVQLHGEHASFDLPLCVDRLGASSFMLSAQIATLGGDIEQVDTLVELIETPLYPWPLANSEEEGWPSSSPNLAGNIMENYQSFSGASSAYWHQGVDIRGDALQEVHSPVDGTVVKWVKYSSSDLYWSFMIMDNLGYVWQFHHMDPDTVSLREGDAVAQGDVIGSIIFWPSIHNDANYHHIHMNVVRPFPEWDEIPEPYIDGWQYFNPLSFFDRGTYNSTQMPTTDGVLYYMENEASAAFASSEEDDVVVSGDIDIVVNLGSEFDATNDLPGHPYVNGLYEVGYSVEPLFAISSEAAMRAATVTRLPLIESEKLPNEWSYVMPELPVAELDHMLRFVYRQSFTYDGRRHDSVFNYTVRKLYYTVTNAVRGEPDSAGAWHTAEVLPNGSRRFPNGDYKVTVYARDFYGNEVHIEHTVTVRN